MSKRVNLLEGKIFTSLATLAIPIMMTSVLQMAYNMIDMIWIGRIGSDGLAAVGAAGMYLWLSNSLATLARMGGQIKVAQLYGKGDMESCAKYASTTVQMGILIGGAYSLAMVVFTKPLIKFFALNSPEVIASAEIYLKIAGGLLIFQFLNQVFTALITATGNSKTPFAVSTVGLIANMILDPILIFGYFGFPKMGVAGAALATIIAQAIVTALYIVYLVKDIQVFAQIKVFVPIDTKKAGEMLKVAIPAALQAAMFTLISMFIARIIASWGDAAIAVQKVGSQVESISWMLAEGFASALNSFVAQNYGAKKYDRARNGYKTALIAMIGWGIITTIILVFLPAPIFKIFLPQSDILPMGIGYLVILGFSQVFMCVEIITCGAFSGYGNTLPPSIISISFTALRIPLAIVLGATALGLNGVWWSITISCICKGIFTPILFAMFMYKLKKKETALGL